MASSRSKFPTIAPEAARTGATAGGGLGSGIGGAIGGAQGTLLGGSIGGALGSLGGVASSALAPVGAGIGIAQAAGAFDPKIPQPLGGPPVAPDRSKRERRRSALSSGNRAPTGGRGNIQGRSAILGGRQ